MADVPVLVVSCDRYADLWRPFFELFWRRWPDFAGEIHLGSNYATYDHPRVQALRVGDDVTWAGSLLRMLDRITGEYVILLLEDFLLLRTVDNARIRQLADIAMSEQVGCLRLYSIFPPENEIGRYPELGSFNPGDSWRITAQAAIWRIATLRKLLVPGFTAWDFELIGSRMSDFMPDRIWGVKQPALVYDHAVEKGRWRPQGLEICREAGIDLDLAKRPAFTPAELQQLEQAGVASVAIARRKTDAMRLFREGRRGAGMREVLSCLRRRPASLQLWTIAMAGLLGARSMTRLQRLHLRMKVASATRRYKLLVRQHRHQTATVRPADDTGRQA